MSTLRFLINYSWILFLSVSLIAFVPLALSAGDVGGIPAWGFWMLSLVFTAVFFVSSAASGICSWYSSKHSMRI